MNDLSSDDHRQRLEEEVVSDLESQNDVVDYEIRDADGAGVLVEVGTADGRRLYRVTLQRVPEGTEDVAWNYIGPQRDR